MTKPRRCAIYARVSTDEQDESLQLTALQELVSQRGWELKATYIDHGVSSRSVRPELEKMMQDAQKRRFDVVAVWKFDRFARSTRELVFALEQFQAQPVQQLRDRVNLRDSITRHRSRVRISILNLIPSL